MFLFCHRDNKKEHNRKYLAFNLLAFVFVTSYFLPACRRYLILFERPLSFGTVGYRLALLEVCSAGFSLRTVSSRRFVRKLVFVTLLRGKECEHNDDGILDPVEVTLL